MNSLGLFQLQQAAFNTAQFAYLRGDQVAFERARKLHSKYCHKWEQAVAREGQVIPCPICKSTAPSHQKHGCGKPMCPLKASRA